jgi:pimeloyl-ACP methyl ester carboxylesterase
MKAIVATAMLGTLLLAACATVEPTANADALARPAGMERTLVPAGDFVLTAYVRLTAPGRPLTLYIEGDGLAWVSRTQPSLDPTPRKATGLALAAADSAPNVAYLARPCQFTPRSMNPRCSVAYWTGKRFAPEVIAAVDQAVGQLATQASARGVNLVGYSGGGAVAVLVAARRNDVISLRTVAGNLDHEAVNRLHEVSPMPESLNAIDVADKVAAIPQIHFSGSDDSVVPPAIAERFRAAVPGSCVTIETVPGATHEAPWADIWPHLVQQVPRCP